MNDTPVYIGYNLHWGLFELKQELARNVIVNFLQRSPRKQGLLGLASGERSSLSKKIEGVFAEIGRDGHYQYNTLEAVIDEVVSIERLFFHFVSSTGCKAVCHHGDPNGPKSIDLKVSVDIFGDALTSVDKVVIDDARSGLKGAFPDLAAKIEVGELPWDERKELLYLMFSLIDIITAMRTGGRIILFNPLKYLVAGQKILSVKTLLDISGLFSVFERQSGSIIVPSAKYDLVGLKPSELFGSKQYIDYCRSHDDVNSLGYRSTAFDGLTHTVSALALKYDKFVDSSTMGFLMTKGIGKLASIATAGVSEQVKELADLLVRLCKDHDRDIIIYSGNNIEEYFKRILMLRLFGEHGPASNNTLRQKLGDVMSDFRKSFGLSDD